MSDTAIYARLGPQQARIYLAIRTAIEQGQLHPGQALDSQASIARRYGVALATLHHALRALEADGYITRRHGVGTFVTERPPEPTTALRAIARFSLRSFSSTRAVADAALQLLAQHIGVRSAFLSRFDGNNLSILADYDQNGCGIRAGAQFPLNHAF
jgi:GntR family transcriptional regulator